MISYNQSACTGCGACVKVCPHHVFEMAGKHAALADEDSCIECGACQLNCHSDAIMVTKGTGCLVAIVKEDILKIRQPGCG